MALNELKKMPLEQRIKESFELMPETDRALADTILNFPGDVLLLSATELAEKSQVSKAAVSRFVRRLGYGDFKEMKTEIREAQKSGAPIFLNSSDLRVLPASEALQAHLHQDIETVNRTLHAADSAMIEEATRKIIAARNIWCLGFRNSAFFAGYIRRQLLQIRGSVTLLPTPAQTLGEELASAGKQDLLIIVGMRRRTRLLHKVMQVMHDRGVPILYFTDQRAITTPKLATWSFACHVRGTSLFDSYVGLLSLLNFICAKAAAAAGKPGRAYLEDIEDALRDFDELSADN